MSRQYDTIAGYQLEVGPAWAALSPDERARLCNGVGAADQPEWLGRLLDALPYLTPASIPHDIDYWVGGSWLARWQADRRFRRNAYLVARAKIGPFWARLFRSTARAEWAFAVVEIEAAYVALRAAGWRAYAHTPKEPAP